jgi:hypothetical protein
MIAPPKRHRPLRRFTAAAVTGVVAVGLCGCVVEGPPLRHARAESPPEQPDDLPPGSVVLTVSQFPEDTDADGYADTILATAHLFSHDPRYPLPITPPGTMRFFLQNGTGQILAEWRFEPDKTARHRHPSGVGVGYVFQLDLAKAGAEHVAAMDATLRCEFVPESGAQAVHSRGGVTVALGPVR